MMKKNDDLQYLESLYPYFKMLDNINKSLNKIIKNNERQELYINEELFYDISSELLRLMPYRVNENNEIILKNKDGIFLLSNKLPYIKEKYDKILNFAKYKKVLCDIAMVRNKYIHEPHNISFAFSVGGKTSFSMGLYYKNRLLSISSITLSPIIYYLNDIFNTIKNDAIELFKNNEKLKEFQYYKILNKFCFDNKKMNYTILPEYVIMDY